MASSETHRAVYYSKAFWTMISTTEFFHNHMDYDTNVMGATENRIWPDLFKIYHRPSLMVKHDEHVYCDLRSLWQGGFLCISNAEKTSLQCRIPLFQFHIIQAVNDN